MEVNALQARTPQQWLANQAHSEAELDVLRRFICADFKGAPPSDGELMFFMLYCRRHGLDPFSRQAHLLKTKNGPQVCLGIDAMRIRAAATQQYAGQDEPAFEHDQRGAILACKVVVYRLVGGQRVGFPGIAWMGESRGTSPIWGTRPRGMLEKCAEAKALRKAFPESCGAFYAPEELDDAAPVRAARVGGGAAQLNARLKERKADAESVPPDDAQVIDADFEEDAPPHEFEGSKPDLAEVFRRFADLGISRGDVLDYVQRSEESEITPHDVDGLRGWYSQLRGKK